MNKSTVSPQCRKAAGAISPNPLELFGETDGGAGLSCKFVLVNVLSEETCYPGEGEELLADWFPLGLDASDVVLIYKYTFEKRNPRPSAKQVTWGFEFATPPARRWSAKCCPCFLQRCRSPVWGR